MRAQTSIKYIDADGIEKTATATAITNGSELKDGWYYVSGKVEVTGRITVNATGDGANIILEDDCDFTVTDGIQVGGTNKLTIYGQSTGTNTGKLTANNTSNDAGIGGNDYGDGDGGTITINGGTVTATSINGAGIGGGFNGDGGTIAINGGTVTAKSSSGAGIGGGDGGSGGTITINGGTVEATGKEGGAGIGSGTYGSGGDITISGGTVKATGDYGAGIGGGGGTIAINGGTVTANGGYGAGIGGGFNGDGGTIAINGGTVTATGSYGGAGIGGGYNGSGGTITITGGTVKATSSGDAGIGYGRGYSGSDGTVTITGGSVQAASISPLPTNGDNSTPVYLNTLTLSGVSVVTQVTAGSINGTDCANAPDAASGVYGIKDVQTDAAGKVYFYLPASGNDETIRLADGSNYYQETFTRPANITAKTLNKEVTAAAIDGVTLPVAGATPVAAITETEQYTGTVSWNGNPSTFAPATTYTATITLTPKTGYTLAGVIADFFTVTGATTVANSAGSGVITAEFPAAAPPPTYGITVGSFTGGSVSANKALAAAGETVTLTVYPAGGYELGAISVFKTGYPTVSVGLNGFNGVNGLNGDFIMPDYAVTVSASFSENLPPEPDPDAVALDGFIYTIRNLHVIVPQEEANTESEVADWLKAYLARLFEDKGWDISVQTLTVVNFFPATAGTRTDMPGTNGSFSFFAILRKGYVTDRTYNMDGTVTATPYTTPVGNESAEVPTSVYFRKHTLYICSPVAETVEVYSFSGAKLFSAKKEAGEAGFTVPASREAVIVRGSSGWTRKAVNN
ncbi:hypothetical protein FACS1894181_00250 [Bacteroidia bacterium]|nr:hypothetical protein FACS1894181_00250 [Bacteroidia bacterium]